MRQNARDQPPRTCPHSCRPDEARRSLSIAGAVDDIHSLGTGFTSGKWRLRGTACATNTTCFHFPGDSTMGIYCERSLDYSWSCFIMRKVRLSWLERKFSSASEGTLSAPGTECRVQTQLGVSPITRGTAIPVRGPFRLTGPGAPSLPLGSGNEGANKSSGNRSSQRRINIWPCGSQKPYRRPFWP
jgi:hypothetical protein